MPEPPAAAEGKCGIREGERGQGAGRGRGKDGEIERREEMKGKGMNERSQRELMGLRPNPGRGLCVREVRRQKVEKAVFKTSGIVWDEKQTKKQITDRG